MGETSMYLARSFVTGVKIAARAGLVVAESALTGVATAATAEAVLDSGGDWRRLGLVAAVGFLGALHQRIRRRPQDTVPTQ
jgi:hypothetical protein